MLFCPICTLSVEYAQQTCWIITARHATYRFTQESDGVPRPTTRFCHLGRTILKSSGHLGRDSRYQRSLHVSEQVAWDQSKGSSDFGMLFWNRAGPIESTLAISSATYAVTTLGDVTTSIGNETQFLSTTCSHSGRAFNLCLVLVDPSLRGKWRGRLEQVCRRPLRQFEASFEQVN